MLKMLPFTTRLKLCACSFFFFNLRIQPPMLVGENTDDVCVGSFLRDEI